MLRFSLRIRSASRLAWMLLFILFAIHCNAAEREILLKPLDHAAAWKRLPPATFGSDSALPTWARTLATVAPKSTAALLELDYAQRTKSPVDGGLRAAMRWVIANVNHCDYAMQAALLDLQSAEVSVVKIESLTNGDWKQWSHEERNALSFARQMTHDSNAIPDERFAELVKDFSDRQAASMVLLAAYGNMQDRLLLCLGADAVTDRQDGVLSALKISFDPSVYVIQQQHPRVTESTDLNFQKLSDLDNQSGIDSAWSKLDYVNLQQRLQTQREKPTRLPIPDWKAVESNVPAGMFKGPSDIVWYRIVFGYAPELAIPFERFMRTAGAETSERYGRIFGTSMFWVVTRAMECAYCMGHCEMNWEVAGLSFDQIAQRSRALASDDWSAFSPQQQHAFAFARKLSQHPENISKTDVADLHTDFGAETALVIAMHVSRYHYMTRISNGFQLKLESENVFYDYWNKSRDSKHDSSTNPTQRSQGAFIELPTDEQTWSRLPKLASGDQQPLPNWVKAVATQLPRTAAAMLELDAIHRMHSPLDPKLRAKLRWVIAKANHCDYSQAYALADLKRAGDEQAIETLTGTSEQWPADERDALTFVQQLTTSAATLSDELFSRVHARFGDQQTVAIVLLAAYGNFQDRIVLGLNLPLETAGPLAPLDVVFVAGALQRAPVLPTNKGAAVYQDQGQAIVGRDEDWLTLPYDQLQQRLELQRDRKPRLRIPNWDEVKSNLPPEMAVRPTKIRWSLLNYGYAPELAIAWTTATRTHWSEQPTDRILEESLFWVQTRAVKCNYCMGHCEMLLEVAGLDAPEVAKRTRLLAESDWSTFPAREQRAYAYARKLTSTPWLLTADDYRSLQADFGDHDAMSVYWWLCRGLYMTRISDGFQLPLERENVFQ